MFSRYYIAAFWAMVGLSLGGSILSAAETLPYGHPDFVASRDRPIGWRGDLNGAFLGATPPLEWNTGTTNVTYYAQNKERTVAPGTNVIWKTPMPNWASCGCIVVDGKVITRASPSTLLCYDAKTGERLWYDSTDVWDYHFKDDPAKAQAMRDLCSKWERQYHLGFGQQGKERIFIWTEAEKNEWVQLTDDILTNHPELFNGKLDGIKARSKWLKTFEKIKAGWWPTEINELEMAHGKKAIRVDPHPWIFHQYGVVANKYINCEDRTISTPVSDGTYVYCASGENLITCHELANGKLVWMNWTGIQKTTSDHGNEYWPSPWIHDKRLIVYNNYTLRGFDLDSGEELWKVPVKYGDMRDRPKSISNKWLRRTGHTHADNCAFMDVGGVKIIVTSTGHVVRARDGKILLDEGTIGSQFGASYGILPSDDEQDIVLVSHGSGQGGKGHALTPEIRNKPRREAWKLKLQDDGGIGAELLWHTQDKKATFSIGPVVHGGKLYTVRCGVFDVLTGKQSNKKRLKTATYQGMILVSGPNGKPFPYTLQTGIGPKPKSEGPRLINEVPEYGDAKYISVNDGSRFAFQGGKPFFIEPDELPVRSWARAALKQGVISRLNAPPVDNGWSNNLYGQPGFPVGNRIYIRSRAMLYCLGEQ